MSRALPLSAPFALAATSATAGDDPHVRRHERHPPRGDVGGHRLLGRIPPSPCADLGERCHPGGHGRVHLSSDIVDLPGATHNGVDCGDVEDDVSTSCIDSCAPTLPAGLDGTSHVVVLGLTGEVAA